jgi:hypothetical protein
MINPTPNRADTAHVTANLTTLAILSVASGFSYGDQIYVTSDTVYYTLTLSSAALTSGVVSVAGESQARWIITLSPILDEVKASTAINIVQTANIATNTSNIAANTSAIALRPLTTDLASTASGKGASLVGVQSGGGTVETHLISLAASVATAEADAQTAITNAATAQSSANTAQSTANGAVSVNTTQTTDIAALQAINNHSEHFWLSRVSSKFGATMFTFDFDDFVDDVIGLKYTVVAFGNLPTIAGTGFRGGVCKLQHNTSILAKENNKILLTPRTIKWAIGGRALMDGTIVANERRAFTFTDTAGQTTATNTISVGMHQSVSATKFSFRLLTAGVTTTAVSTINWDSTTFHNMWTWYDGTSVFGQIDNEPPVLVTNSPSTKIPNVALNLRTWLNDGQVGNGDMYVDNMFAAIQSN